MTAQPLLHPVAAGRALLRNNLALAPMAGITNAAFRILAAEGVQDFHFYTLNQPGPSRAIWQALVR